MPEPSGPQWCARFPGSASLDDLVPDFGDNLRAFISRLHNAGAAVHVEATFRPPERAYLMHWCCRIAGYRDENGFHQSPPDLAPPMPGVAIDWKHGGSLSQARAAAALMVKGYGIDFPAALVSNHTRRRAVDMSISWNGALAIRDFNGQLNTITTLPRDGTNPALHVVGRSFGVIKLVQDRPHWSDDGH